MTYDKVKADLDELIAHCEETKEYQRPIHLKMSDGKTIKEFLNTQCAIDFLVKEMKPVENPEVNELKNKLEDAKEHVADANQRLQEAKEAAAAAEQSAREAGAIE